MVSKPCSLHTKGGCLPACSLFLIDEQNNGGFLIGLHHRTASYCLASYCLLCTLGRMVVDDDEASFSADGLKVDAYGAVGRV